MYQKTLFAVLLVLATAPIALAAGPPAAVSGCASVASPVLALEFAGVLPLEQAIGDIGAAGCCYSDPCPGWGSYKVGCCENGCVAYATSVWCPSSGDIQCPDPCANNGICNSSCSIDPDCECVDFAPCRNDADCGGPQYGFCEVDPLVQDTCVCY